MSKSTILDGNSFKLESSSGLDADSLALIKRREKVLGPSYRLFYSNPVHVVSGRGCHLYDTDGNEYLDAYNNVVSIGHCHPKVIEAVSAQMSRVNTHTRYLQDGIVEYSEKLLETFPPEIGNVMFTCTGSEANDLAIRVARQFTGGQGVVVTAEAYHGTSDLVAGASPAMGTGFPLNPLVRTVPAPIASHARAVDVGEWLARRVAEQFADFERHGIKPAAFLADSIFSSDGVVTDPRGLLRPVIEAVHRAGAVYIADEVQPGFGRTGEDMWGFARQGIVPDLVTLGKPMGNGIPVAAMVARPEVLAPFGEDVPYFNTFGGNPVSIAAANAVLDVIRTEGLVDHVRETGAELRETLLGLQRSHETIGDVRGCGLYYGVELVSDRERLSPDSSTALRIINELRNRHVLISVCGANNNVLKIRPPFPFSNHDVSRLATELDAILSELEDER